MLRKEKVSLLSLLGSWASEELMFLFLPFVGSPWVMAEVTLVLVVMAGTVLRPSCVQSQ